MNALTSERVAALCAPIAQQVMVQVVDETGSTNADLLAALPALVAPTLLVARSQTAGRGRAGRSWLSATGKSLTFSLAWKFTAPLHALVGLPLAVGVALADALATFNVAATLKWPNDLLQDGRKLAGILIETASAGRAANGATWAVIGIGINLALDDSVAQRIGQPVANVPGLAKEDQNVVVAALLSRLAEALVQFEREGLAAFTRRWNALNAYAGRPVVILDGGKLLHEGVAVGVDEIGRFVLDTAAGRVAVMAGDVSLRIREN